MVTWSTCLSFAEGEGRNVYLAFSIVSNSLFPSINMNLRLHEVMHLVKRINVTEGKKITVLPTQSPQLIEGWKMLNLDGKGILCVRAMCISRVAGGPVVFSLLSL